MGTVLNSVEQCGNSLGTVWEQSGTVLKLSGNSLQQSANSLGQVGKRLGTVWNSAELSGNSLEQSANSPEQSAKSLEQSGKSLDGTLGTAASDHPRSQLLSNRSLPHPPDIKDDDGNQQKPTVGNSGHQGTVCEQSDDGSQ